MPEKPDYGEMETKDLPWIIHMMTEAPFNCHTHGLKELGSPVEVSMDAHDPALSLAVGQMLNDVGRYVASTGAVLEDGQVMRLGQIPLHFHAGQCSAHPDDPTFIHLAGIVPQCEECAAEGEIEGTKYHRTVLTYEVLSEEPYVYSDLKTLAYDVRDGDCSGMLLKEEHQEVSAERMAALLEAQGSDPSFFQIEVEDGDEG